MPIVLGVGIESYVAKDLHSNDGVDEKEHGDQQNNIGQCLEGLDERPQKNSDGIALPQEFYQSSSSKQPQEAHIDEILLQKYIAIFTKYMHFTK